MKEEGEILSVIAAPLYLLLERIGDGVGVRPQFPLSGKWQFVD